MADKPKPPQPIQKAGPATFDSPLAHPPAPPVARPSQVVSPVRLRITGRVTIPAAPGYARRLTNLITNLKRSVEEEAPWLTEVEVEVET